MQDNWIYLPDGGYPADKQAVIILILTRYRDPHYNKGKEGFVDVKTAIFRSFDDRREWQDIPVSECDDFIFIRGEYECHKDYNEPNKPHPDMTDDTYIVAWQPMPEPPKDLVWPPRKPLSKWIAIRQCACGYSPDPTADPKDTQYCPRCGTPLYEMHIIDPVGNTTACS